MTLAFSNPEAAPASRGQPRTVPTQPGLIERAMVVLTTFVFLHQTPNVWFRSRADTLADSSNPLLVVLELALIGFALLRVVGSIDLLIAMVKLETTIYLFSGLLLATMFWSADPGGTMRKGIVFVAVTLYASYLVLRFSIDQIIRLLAVMFAVSAMVNVMFIVAFPQFGIDVDNQFTGVFSQKNALGYAATLGIPTLVIASRAWQAGRLFFYPAILILFALLLGSESKTMLVATLGPTFLMVVYNLFRSRRTLRGAVIASLAGSALFSAAFATANIALLADWLDKDITLTGRVPMWENLIPVALERPFLGHGYGATFDGFFSPVHEVLIQNRWNPSHAHNALLQLWLEAGAVAVVLFLIIYGRAVLRAIKIVALVPGAVGLWPLVFLTTTLLVSITESGVTNELTGWMMYVVSVLSVALHLKHRDDLGLSNDLQHADHQPPAAARLSNS